MAIIGDLILWMSSLGGGWTKGREKPLRIHELFPCDGKLWVGHLEKGKESVEMGLVMKTLRALDISLEVTLQRPMPFTGKLLK